MQDKTHSTLILCIFKTSFLHSFFVFFSSQLVFLSHLLFLSSFTTEHNAPPNLSFSTIDVLVMQSGQIRKDLGFSFAG